MPISSLSSRERELVTATVAFANLKLIETNRQVEDLFCIAEADRIGEDLSLYRAELQPLLRRWLRQVISGNGGRAQTSLEIAHLMPSSIVASPVFVADRLSYAFRLPSVEAGCILALALILDEDRGLTGRLQQCTLSWCGLFNVDFDAQSRPRKYCSPNHRMLAHYEQSPERMRQWRKAA